MKDNLNDLLVKDKIEYNILNILDKHEVFYIRDNHMRNFICMINMGNLFFEIFEHESSTYLTTKYSQMGHFKFSNDNPEKIYEVAEMIGFLIGRKYANPYYAV